MKYFWIFLLICGVCSAETINRQNFTVDDKFTSDKNEYFMCNFNCKIPDTLLPLVKNCNFKKCNLFGCEVDGTNILVKSNLIDTSYVPPEPTEEELKARVKQLEDYIKANSLPVPKEMNCD